MSKEETNKTRYCVQWNAHERYMCTVLCSLMEHQSLVDLAICCGNNTIHVHKCILAANSAYFREQLEKNTSAEQVIINGLDFVIIKSIIEFIYCGETVVPDENMKYVIAAAKVFQIRGLQALASEVGEFSGGGNGDQVYIPPPVFISKKPKYPTAFRPFNTLSIQPTNINKSFSPYEQLLQKKIKRKYMKSEAERACAKEAAASRQALEALQKELAIQPQVNSFVIEDSCTETTVENFIPHADERFVENVRDFQGLPVVNYYSVNGTGYANRGQPATVEKSLQTNPLLQFNIRNEGNPPANATPADKVKGVLEGDITHNVEIMFKTSEGDFVSVTDELLQNISKSALQYQVIDENGFAGEMQELRVVNKVLLDPAEMSHKFIYEQEGLNPSIIEIPKVDQNTPVELENATNKDKTADVALPAGSSDVPMKEADKSDVEACLDMLLPAKTLNTTNPCDADKEAFVSTTDSFMTDFSLSTSDMLDYQNVLEGVGVGVAGEKSDLEGCSAEKKQKLMEDHRDVVDLGVLNDCEEILPAVLQFSPRRTRSTMKCRNRGGEGENEGDVMMKTRKSK